MRGRAKRRTARERLGTPRTERRRCSKRTPDGWSMPRQSVKRNCGRGCPQYRTAGRAGNKQAPTAKKKKIQRWLRALNRDAAREQYKQRHGGQCETDSSRQSCQRNATVEMSTSFGLKQGIASDE